MFHKTFKRAVYAVIAACATFALMRPPVTASAATTQHDDPAATAQDAGVDLDPAAATGQAAWQGQQAGSRYASWSTVFTNPPR